MAEGKIYVAVQDGLCQLPDGNYVTLKTGVTRVREGHPLLKGRESMFKELDVHYDLEDMRAAPEQKKQVPKAEEPKAAEKAEGPAGLTSKDAPQTPARGRGRGRVTKTD